MQTTPVQGMQDISRCNHAHASACQVLELQDMAAQCQQGMFQIKQTKDLVVSVPGAKTMIAGDYPIHVENSGLIFMKNGQ